MLIGELAGAVDLPSQTIRLYERQGLLPQPGRAANGYRTHDDSTVSRVRFIRSAQAAGLTLGEIASIVDVRDHGDTPCTHVATLLKVVRHVEVFPVGSVRTSIIGRPRRLPSHRRAHHPRQPQHPATTPSMVKSPQSQEDRLLAAHGHRNVTSVHD